MEPSLNINSKNKIDFRLMKAILPYSVYHHWMFEQTIGGKI